MQDGANWLAEFWQWVRSESGMIALSGAAGGAVRSVRFRESPKQSAASIFVGMLCASFLESSIAPYLPPKLSHFGIGFLIGIAGIAIVGFIQDFVQAYRNRVKGDRP